MGGDSEALHHSGAVKHMMDALWSHELHVHLLFNFTWATAERVSVVLWNAQSCASLASIPGVPFSCLSFLIWISGLFGHGAGAARGRRQEGAFVAETEA